MIINIKLEYYTLSRRTHADSFIFILHWAETEIIQQLFIKYAQAVLFLE